MSRKKKVLPSALPNPPSELVFNSQMQVELFENKVKTLRCLINDYQSLPESDGADRKTFEANILSGMQGLAKDHPDPEERQKWKKAAEAFADGDEKEKSSILTDVGIGLALILATPFALAGAVIVGAGAIVYGVGSVIKGVGNALTFGLLDS